MNETTRIIPAEHRPALLRFVRECIAAELDLCPAPALPELPELTLPGACFVSLYLVPGKHLRGCIGNLEAFEPLGENLRRNALSAAFADPRFAPLDAEELAESLIEISVLGAPRPIAAPEEFAVGEHGIILNCAGRRAVFLPQVAPEQGWDRETTLDHLARKAGLPAAAWRGADARLSVFGAEFFAEDGT